jgi:hypothetical protein
MASITSIHLHQLYVVVYFVKAIRHYKDKEMLVVPFNTSNNWVTLPISTKYEYVWYYNSSRSIDSRTDDRLTRDWTDVIFVLDE